MPVYFVWLKYLSWFKYSNEYLAVNQWKDVSSIGEYDWIGVCKVFHQIPAY